MAEPARRVTPAGQTTVILLCVAAMRSPAPHKELIQWLADLLRQGIIIGRDVIAFMEATFGSADLGALLDGSGDAETDSLLELIFYPGPEAQLRYESRWGGQPFSLDRQSEIEAALCALPITVPLLLPDADDHPSIEPPDFALAAFVQRLNITWRPEASLAGTIGRSWPGDPGLRARVLMRNAGLVWHQDQIRLMDHFFIQFSAEAADAGALLPFLLCLMSELKPGADAFEFLLAKKFFYFQSLCKAEDFERKRRTTNMETMMLQGSRSSFGSIDQWRANMRHIDILCRQLFGRTHFFQQPEGECIDLQTGDGGQHIKDVIRILS